MVPVLFFYLLKLSVSLAMVYLFYRLVLQHLTFYHWNRWYLLACTALSFLIPLVDVSEFWTGRQQAPLPAVTQYIPPVAAFAGTDLARPEAAATAFDAWNWLLLVLLSGIGVLLVKLGAQFFSFIRIRQRARLISDQRIKIYQVDADILPFSFGRSVFLNQALHRQQDLPEIIRHEFVHVQQGHTVDVIWIELVCMLNWYNPFAWLLRRHLRQNLEYIADNQVLQAGIDKKHYQYLLLQVTGDPAFRLAQPFNFSSLKKRIMMMNKMPSARPQLARFLFLLPLVAVLLLAFRGVEKPGSLPGPDLEKNNPVSGDQTVSAGNNAQTSREEGQKVAVRPQPQPQQQPQPQPQPQQEQPLQQEEQQRRLQQQQKKLQQQKQLQQQQLRQQEQNAVQQGIIGRDSIRAPKKMQDAYQSFMKRNTQVKGLSWQKGDKVIIHLRSGKQETYDLNDKKSLAALEKKYGKLPAPPPPPPAPPVPQSPAPHPPAGATDLPAPPPPKGDNMGAFDAKDPNRLPADYKAFLKRNPQVEKLIWYWGEDLHKKPVQVVVIQKSGAQESYHFSRDAEMAGAERKYGKLPWPAPPAASYDVPPPVPARPEKPKGLE